MLEFFLVNGKNYSLTVIPLFISGIATNLWRNKIKSIIDNTANSRNIFIRDLFIVVSVILQVTFVTLANLFVDLEIANL